MREIRTSGSTSGGVETDRMGAGLSTKRKRGTEAPDPTRHRATPRLYFRITIRQPPNYSLAAIRNRFSLFSCLLTPVTRSRQAIISMLTPNLMARWR